MSTSKARKKRRAWMHAITSSAAQAIKFARAEERAAGRREGESAVLRDVAAALPPFLEEGTSMDAFGAQRHRVQLNFPSGREMCPRYAFPYRRTVDRRDFSGHAGMSDKLVFEPTEWACRAGDSEFRWYQWLPVGVDGDPDVEIRATKFRSLGKLSQAMGMLAEFNMRNPNALVHEAYVCVDVAYQELRRSLGKFAPIGVDAARDREARSMGYFPSPYAGDPSW